MAYENNHYVPKLVLRRFSEKICTYNLKTKEFKENLSLNNAFSKYNLYNLEIEKSLNKYIESSFATILNNNILKEDKYCSFKRSELYKIKKFLLIAMLRCRDTGEYLERHRCYDKALDEIYKFQESNTKSLSNKEYWLRSIKSVLESNSRKELINNPEATNAAVRWWIIYEGSYLAIWDCNKTGEKFLITDEGMTSEHEKFNHICGGDKQKKGYLIRKINDNVNIEMYLPILLSQDFMHENFYLFSVSATRMLALINPFYRLYDKNSGEISNALEKPDIWPTKISDTKMFKKNRVKYETGENPINHKENDEFIYEIINIDLQNTIYINCLMMDRISEIVGFSNIQDIIRSIRVYNSINGRRNDFTSLLRTASIDNNNFDDVQIKKILDSILFNIEDFNELENDMYIRLLDQLEQVF